MIPERVMRSCKDVCHSGYWIGERGRAEKLALRQKAKSMVRRVKVLATAEELRREGCN